MRKIVAGLFITLDGVVEAPETWTGSHLTDEINQHIRAMTAAGDTMLLGRVTYQELAAAFSGQNGATADQMNSTPKIVISTTLDTAGWQNSTLIKANIVGEIIRLRQRPGKNITITGSPSLVRSLLRDGLLDELSLIIFPIVLGTGKRLFGNDGDQTLLRLAEATILSTGVLKLTYQPAAVGRLSRYLAPALKPSGLSTSKPKASPSRSVALNAAHTASASLTCYGATPAASTSRMSCAVSSLSAVSWPSMRSVARSGSSIGAVSRSASTAVTRGASW